MAIIEGIKVKTYVMLIISTCLKVPRVILGYAPILAAIDSRMVVVYAKISYCLQHGVESVPVFEPLPTTACF